MILHVLPQLFFGNEGGFLLIGEFGNRGVHCLLLLFRNHNRRNGLLVQQSIDDLIVFVDSNLLHLGINLTLVLLFLRRRVRAALLCDFLRASRRSLIAIRFCGGGGNGSGYFRSFLFFRCSSCFSGSLRLFGFLRGGLRIRFLRRVAHHKILFFRHNRVFLTEQRIVQELRCDLAILNFNFIRETQLRGGSC